MEFFLQTTYFVAAILFILGLKGMSSPANATQGIKWAGVGMLVAILATFMHPAVHGFTNIALIIIAAAIGGYFAWTTAKKVVMTDMPQMVALYNGLGGGAAALIGAVLLIGDHNFGITVQILTVLGSLIGTMAFSGSLVAFGKLQGLIKKTVRFKHQQLVNSMVFFVTVLLGVIIAFSGNDINPLLLIMFFILTLVFGVLVTVPIGGADMPVVISLFNALTGLAVGFKGYVLDNPSLMIAGIVVGSAGVLLTQLMAKAMNRSIRNVLFSNFGETTGDEMETTGSIKEIEASDAAVMMAFAEKVIIVPGYGMAVAQAQHKVWELIKQLQERDVTVKIAIHPVAGRMPGHMNVLLAEANIPYDIIYDMEEINGEFATADVTLIIGANDVVNPVARIDENSPIYGMPILNADKSRNVIIIKRGKGTGFSGVENHLFFADNARMLYGDAQQMVGDLSVGVKEF
jgi:NAD(P) transhydrogenase subunit beta